MIKKNTESPNNNKINNHKQHKIVKHRTIIESITKKLQQKCSKMIENKKTT